MDKYWIVQSYGEQGHRYGQRYFRHPNREAAEREAKRLTGQTGKTFVVLETVACFRPPEPKVESVPLD